MCEWWLAHCVRLEWVVGRTGRGSRYLPVMCERWLAHRGVGGGSGWLQGCGRGFFSAVVVLWECWLICYV